ncbi:MAG: hypothetical protein LBU88_02745 [Treponema sp.]|jgi:hypothetical protein|nr:hypothetical protein [Treponema sp.]
MKKQIILFSLRLFFYISVLVLLTIHPGISISFDLIGILQWFIIIPMQAVIAFIPKTITSLKRRFIVAGVSLVALSLLAGGFSITFFQPFFAGIVSFFLTYLLFHYPRWGKLSALEPLFLIWVCLRLLALSRSGEEIAGQSIALTQFLLVWSAVVFLLHGVVVYFCLFPHSKRGAWKEGMFFLAGAAAALVLVLAVLPPDFIRNSIIENINRDRAPERIPEDPDGGLPRDSRRQGRRTLPNGGSGQRPGLRGMSEHDWQNARGRGSGSSESNMQYLVKVAASEIEPVYMGDNFRGQLDPVKGFLVSENEPLNNLSGQRLFSTWQNSEENYDMDRVRLEVFSLSTLTQKYLPYFPKTVDPTILNEDSGPLRYIHQVESFIHAYNPLLLVNEPLRELTAREKQRLAHYMDVPLEREDMALFGAWLHNANEKWKVNRSEKINNDPYLYSLFYFSEDGETEAAAEAPPPVNNYLESLFSILTAFSEYQYNLSYNEDTAIKDIKEFLFETKDGDCTEFSNSLALLGRMAGIPSRVVTGYLVSEGLQTEAHLRGLVNLRRQIPVLQQFPFDNLFLVTNLHAHSWVQFYIPNYGWLDFEATQFAIPPLPSGDFNTWDVVIPVLDKKRVFSNVRKFPWMAVFHAAGVLAVTLLVAAYALRYGREAVLHFGTRKGGREGARALYLLLLARLAADGKPIKPASRTATEYSELFVNSFAQRHRGAEDFDVCFDHFKNFAGLYSKLRWYEFDNKTENENCFNQLKQEYINILNTTKSKGLHRWFIRIINLRGLAYL